MKSHRLPAVKNYLYKSILESLTRFHEGKSADSLLCEWLKQVELLYIKSLFPQCMKLIGRAKKLALRHEKFTRLLDLLEWEKMVHIAMRYSELDRKKLKRIHAGEQDLLKRIGSERMSVFHGLELSLIVQSKGFTSNKDTLRRMSGIMKRTVMRDDYRHSSFRSRLFALSSQTTYHLITGNLEKSLHYAGRRIALMERNPGRLRDEVTGYIQSVNNYIITCEHMGGRHDDIERAIVRLQRLKEEGYVVQENAALRLFLVLNARKCGFYIATARFEEAKGLEREIESGLDRYRSSVSDHDRIVFCYFMAYLFFGNGDQGSATRWLNRIIQHPFGRTREDLQALARILALLINYDKGNEDYLIYLLPATAKFLRQKKQLFAFEKVIIRALRHLVSRRPEGKERTESFVSMKEQLGRLAEDKHTRKMLSHFDFDSWLNSKISGQPFAKIAREKAGRKV